MKKYFNCKGYSLPLGKKTYIMGILNVTPDSFSDGGKFINPERAIKRAREMVKEGADIIDIGGESTRPGFSNIKAEEEIDRIMPVLKVLTKELRIPISLDTNKSDVARAALEEGVQIINDIWGLHKDPLMAEIIAKYKAGVIIMHNKEDTFYKDLMGEVKGFLERGTEIAKEGGIEKNSIIIDPGIGFGKTFEQNLEVLKRLQELKDLGFPILLGSSRKSFIGKILDLPVRERMEGTAASVALGIASGVDIVRVHDVGEIRKVVKVADAIVRFKR